MLARDANENLLAEPAVNHSEHAGSMDLRITVIPVAP